MKFPMAVRDISKFVQSNITSPLIDRFLGPFQGTQKNHWIISGLISLVYLSYRYYWQPASNSIWSFIIFYAFNLFVLNLDPIFVSLLSILGSLVVSAPQSSPQTDADLADTDFIIAGTEPFQASMNPDEAEDADEADEALEALKNAEDTEDTEDTDDTEDIEETDEVESATEKEEDNDTGVNENSEVHSESKMKARNKNKKRDEDNSTKNKTENVPTKNVLKKKTTSTDSLDVSKMMDKLMKINGPDTSKDQKEDQVVLKPRTSSTKKLKSSKSTSEKANKKSAPKGKKTKAVDENVNDNETEEVFEESDNEGTTLDEEEDDEININETILKSINNLSKEQFGAINKDTKELLDTQRQLMSTVQGLAPVIEQGKGFLKQMKGMFGDNK